MADERYSLLGRIVHGRLAGRVSELSLALAQLERARAGEGNVLVIRGEPGVGKTRFAHELIDHAQASGSIVLSGECYAEASMPYAPVATIIRQGMVHPRLGDLIPSNPALGYLFSRVPVPTLLPPEASLSSSFYPESEQQRLFEGVAAWCEVAATRSPLLWFIDDVHWADSGTLFLLRHLARRGRKLPLLMVMTCREADWDKHGALTEVLLDLNRERLATFFTLHPLNRDETRDLLAFMFSGEASLELLEDIYRQTEGNPFFIEEVCKSLVEEGLLAYQAGHWQPSRKNQIKIPQTVRATIQARVTKLTQPTQDALRMAAVLGREFDIPTLELASNLDRDTLVSALEEAMRAQLIVEIPPNRTSPSSFAFVHVLIPTTLSESVIHLRRQQMHLRAAQAIQALHPDDFETLAYHYGEAGENDSAWRYYQQAGDRARQAAPGDAVRFYQSALEKWPDGNIPERAELTARQGYCFWVIGDVPGALKSFDDAYNLFERVGNHAQCGEMQRMIGRMHWERADRALALEHYHQALAILEKGPETVELARAISSISQMYMLAPQDDLAITWGQRALTLAERLGAEDVVAHALNNIGSSYAHAGDYDKGYELLQESLKRSLAAGLSLDACRAYYNITEMLQRQCRYARAKAILQELYAYSKKVYAKNYANLAIWRLMWIEWLTGQWRSALDYRSQLVDFSNSLYTTWTKRIIGMIDLDLGKIKDAQRELEDTLPSALRAMDMQTTITHLGQMVRVYAILGQDGRTLEMADQVIAFMNDTPYLSADLIMPVFLTCQQLAKRSNPDSLAKAQACLAKLEQHSQQYQTGEAAAALAQAKGYLAVHTQPAAAAEQFRQAGLDWDSIGRPYDQARALAGLGRALAAAGDSTEAHNAVDQALVIVISLAAQLPEELKSSFLDSSLLREIHKLAETLPKPNERAAARRKYGGLTEREREIAALIASGKSNRAIAEQLVVTERTVEKHVENIMTRLGFNARTQIAAWAVEVGLTATPS